MVFAHPMGRMGRGRRPIRRFALIIILAMWLGFAAFYATAAQQGAIVPAKREIFEDKRYESCRPPKGNWTTCPALASVQPTFNPLIYSADVILPIISFGQGSEWRPAYDRSVRLGDVTLPPAAVSWAKSIEIAIGWICGLLLGAVVSGFIKKE
jgi:hypothetical protein